MKIIFSYGKKVEIALDKLKAITQIAEKFGLETINVEYLFDDTPDQRVAKMGEEIKKYQNEKLIFVGTSMGSYASIVNSMTVSPEAMFLMSPAIFMDGYNVQKYSIPKNTTTYMMVGWEDSVIPIDKVLEFAEDNKLPLLMVKDDHALSQSIEEIKLQFNHFLEQILKE